MPAALPHHAVRALAEAFPYRAEQAFLHAQVQLGRDDASELDVPTRTLADAYEREVGRIARGHSLTTLRELRERAWFANSPHARHVPLQDHLALVASTHLHLEGNAVLLHEGADPEVALRWRMLSLYLPADLLIASLSEQPPTSLVELGSPGLRSLLSQGVCETHLHLGAAMPFDLLWLSLQHGLASSRFDLDTLPPAGVPFSQPRVWIARLLAAALVRHLLLAFVWHRALFGQPAGGFEGFIETKLGSIASSAGRPELVVRACRTAIWQLCAPLSCAEPSSVVELRLAHRLLWGETHRVVPRSISELVACDPVSRWLPAQAGRARPETCLLARCLAYLRSYRDDGFARAFWQYTRIRTLAHAHLVETPGVAGLDWFTRHYDRIAWYRQSLDTATVSSAFELASHGVNLQALELRVGPPARWPETRDALRSVVRQALDWELPAAAQRPELGLVFHFIKRARDHAGHAHGSPRGSGFGCRHGRWIADAEQRARAIASVLRHEPEFALVLRGIDVASAELAQPTWALLSSFELVRRAFAQASGQLAKLRPHWRVDPGRTTMHLGEDFRRLSDGLRRVHEAIATGLLRRGDRIGHGLVLGIDVAAWAAQATTTLQPAEERLDDLLWEIELIEAGAWSSTDNRLSRIRAEATRLGACIHAPSTTVEQLLRARLLRHDLAVLRSFQLPWYRAPIGRLDDAMRLLAAYLSDEGVFARGQELVEIHNDPEEVRAMIAMQSWLRRKVARLELTIESNPSSNLLIGDFMSLHELPLFHLVPWEGPVRSDLRLHVSINTDDPISFATRLADEYAHIHRALIHAGASSSQAADWLEDARTSGYRSRFTLPTSSLRKYLEALAQPIGPRRRW